MDFLFCEYPAWKGQIRHHLGLEVVVPLYCCILFSETVTEECKRKLCRTRPRIAPFKAGRTVVPQVQAGIEGDSVNGYVNGLADTLSFIALHWPPPQASMASS